MLHSLCVEWNCHYFFSFLSVIFLFVPVVVRQSSGQCQLKMTLSNPVFNSDGMTSSEPSNQVPLKLLVKLRSYIQKNTSCAEMYHVNWIECRPCDATSSQSPNHTASRWQPSIPWTSHARSYNPASQRSPAAACNAGTSKTQLKQHIFSNLCCPNVFQHHIISPLKAADMLDH